MQAWIRNRAKTRKDGRTVFVSSVSFDLEVFDELSKCVHRERQRSAIINEAIRYCLAIPGWRDAILRRLAGEKLAPMSARPPSSNSRIHARGGVEGPKTKRSPGSRPPKSKAARSSKRGGGVQRK